MPYRHAAVAWLARRLRGPIDESAELVARVAAIPDAARARWRSLRGGLGELERLTIKESHNSGPLGATAGSYEPEVHGFGPDRVKVTLAATGSLGAADVVVTVIFPGGLSTAPEVSLESAHGRARTQPRAQEPTRPTAEERELLRLSEAICAAPDDNEPRAQLAALWMARGEPRGDFVRAQLAGNEARAQALLAAHGEHWTDGLPVDRDGRVYRRGFLAEARVACSPNALAEAIDNPAWNLLTALHHSVMDDIEEEFLEQARLGSLRRLAGISADAIESTPLPPRVTHVQAHGRVYVCPKQLKALEIDTFSFEDLWVFARQQKHPQLALLSVSARRELEGADLLVVQALLEPPRPARLVLSVLRPEPEETGEVWRLDVTGETWDFAATRRCCSGSVRPPASRSCKAHDDASSRWPSPGGTSTRRRLRTESAWPRRGNQARSERPVLRSIAQRGAPSAGSPPGGPTLISTRDGATGRT